MVAWETDVVLRMSALSRILACQINWDKADAEQKVAGLDRLTPNDPPLGKLALREAAACASQGH